MDLNSSQTASLGRIFQGYGLAEAFASLQTVVGFNMGIFGVDTLRGQYKAETVSEATRHGIRLVDYSRLMVNFDRSGLIRRNVGRDNVRAVNAYEDETIRASEIYEKDIVNNAAFSGCLCSYEDTGMVVHPKSRFSFFIIFV